jgi:hypothetical protein
MKQMTPEQLRMHLYLSDGELALMEPVHLYFKELRAARAAILGEALPGGTLTMHLSSTSAGLMGGTLSVHSTKASTRFVPLSSRTPPVCLSCCLSGCLSGCSHHTFGHEPAVGQGSASARAKWFRPSAIDFVCPSSPIAKARQFQARSDDASCSVILLGKVGPLNGV